MYFFCPVILVDIEAVEVDDPEPRLLVGNIIPAVSQASYPSLIIESSKLLEQIQIQHAGLVGFTSVINASHAVQIVSEEKETAQKDTPTSSYETSEAFSHSSATYASPERYNYQNYG